MNTKLVMALVAGTVMLAPTAYAKNAQDFDASQKTQIETIVHDYLIAHPDVVVEAVRQLQEKQMMEMKQHTQEAAVKNADVLLHQASDPVIGNPTGKVTVVEFFDYQCPHCVAMAPAVTALIKSNPELRVVLKEFPIRGPISVDATKAAFAAKAQGKYQAFYEGLMKVAEKMDENTIYTVAKSVGLDVDKLKVDMKSPEVDALIKANYKLAQSLQLMGTPALFIAKTNPAKGSPVVMEFIGGQVGQADLQAAIDKASH